MSSFVSVLEEHDLSPQVLARSGLTTLQLNLGNLCNQSCRHCHIGASPKGKKIMSKKVINDILKFVSKYEIETLDITGGAPELNPHFDYLVTSARLKVEEIIVRSNLTVLLTPGKEYLPRFFKKNKVHLICSLPCYTAKNTDGQRGRGVFRKSIKALKLLNSSGYAKSADLKMDLAHNPAVANLAGAQGELEQVYRQRLKADYGVEFNRLIVITNVAINRFKKQLKENNQYDSYLNLLRNNFNPQTTRNIMCRKFLSVGYDGRIYDCDFNLALNLGLKDKEGRTLTINDISPDRLEESEIIFDDHCFSCTAVNGSSCQGELVAAKSNIRESVKSFYGDAAARPKKELCCPSSYKKEDLSFIPQEVLEVSYGCGSPISLAQPQPDEVAVDLGCGAGIDCFIAAKKVGASGKVIGVDMTEEMLAKARSASKKVAENLGFLNCEFRKGFLENIPVDSGAVDLVTSNCVVNLSYDKEKVFKEIYRILKNGGRFVISDIVSDKEVPLQMQNDRTLWGKCLSGALTQDEFLNIAKKAGFCELEVLKSFPYREVEGIKFYSITVCGYKLKKPNVVKSGCCCA